MTDESKIRSFDFHCHVDLDSNPPDLIQKCEEYQVAVLAVTTTPKAWSQNLEWTRGSRFVHAAVGLHPELVGERFSEIELLEQHIADTHLVGEVGLDGSSKYRNVYFKQKEVFERALIAANKHGGRVISIHSRKAARDVLRAIERHIDRTRVLCVLHWFSGSIGELREALRLGCYFSVNSSMLASKGGTKLIESIPLDRLLTETDSPFVKVKGRPSTPWDTVELVGPISELFGLPSNEISETMWRNSTNIFQFAGIEFSS